MFVSRVESFVLLIIIITVTMIIIIIIYCKKVSNADRSGRSLAGAVGWNPARGMDVCPLWMLCVVR